MTTEGQIEANRANAQRSTGPRTPEGKAIVARNAVKHGLLGEQIIVEGEDRARFARHHDAMLRALVPVAEVEVTLAERLIGLSWRLQRVQRLQVQAFEALCAGPVEGPADEGSDEELALGRIVVKDFAEARVLDRLLMYERRIEHSLCRMLGELRKERLFHNLEARTMDEGQPQVLLERLMGKLRDSPSAVLRVERGSARYEKTPEDAARVEVVEGVSSLKGQVSTEESQAPAPPGLPTSPCHLHPAALQFSRQTNPISDGDDAEQALSHAGVTDGSAPNCPEETNPISQEAPSLKCQVSSEASRVAIPLSLPTSNCTLATSGGQSCETNPICGDPGEEQSLCSTGVRSDPAPGASGETKPISEGVSSVKCEVSSEQSQAAAPLSLVTSNFTLETAAQPPSCETKPIAAGGKRERFGYTPVFRRRR
jgi:hypothetical protein